MKLDELRPYVRRFYRNFCAHDLDESEIESMYLTAENIEVLKELSTLLIKGDIINYETKLYLQSTLKKIDLAREVKKNYNTFKNKLAYDENKLNDFNAVFEKAKDASTSKEELQNILRVLKKQTAGLSTVEGISKYLGIAISDYTQKPVSEIDDDRFKQLAEKAYKVSSKFLKLQVKDFSLEEVGYLNHLLNATSLNSEDNSRKTLLVNLLEE